MVLDQVTRILVDYVVKVYHTPSRELDCHMTRCTMNTSKAALQLFQVI